VEGGEAMRLVTEQQLKELVATRKQPELKPEPPKHTNGNANGNGHSKDKNYPPLMTQELLQKIEDALTVLDPNDTRGGKPKVDLNNPKNTWLRIVLAVASLQSDKAKEVLRTWSEQSDKYDENEFNKAYNSYKADLPNPIRIGTLFKFAEAKQKQSLGNQSPFERLRAMSSTGKSKEMKQQMLDDKFIMKDIAILGQSTAIAAPPNTAKTLYTIHSVRESVKAGVIEGNNVWYINADDHGKGAVEKLEIVEPYGINMLIPGWQGFKTADLLPIMREAIDTHTAKDQIIILDTLKKFADLMDKKASTEFTKLAREFQLKGGSLIMLMHCNKGRDKEGKLIVAGTSDISDDSDCVFVFDPVGENEGVHTIECEMRKSRGDVASLLSFQFTRQRGQTYAQLLDSIKPLDENQLAFARETENVRHRLEENAEVIKVIARHIVENNKLKVPRTKRELIEHIAKDAGIGQKKVRRVMNYHEGDEYDKGYRWTSVKVGNERTEYKLLDPPCPY
jgi:hypothetical protein